MNNLFSFSRSRILAALIAFSLSFGVHAQVAKTAAELERGLVGQWVGALEYRDYRTNEKQELPMTNAISALPDGVTVTRVSTFDDGPVTGLVYITTIKLFDLKTPSASNAVFRKGRALDTWTDNALVTRFLSDTQWTVVYQHDGSDNNKPATLRTTQTRDGDMLSALKEVKPIGAPDSEYAFRNIIRLKRKY